MAQKKTGARWLIFQQWARGLAGGYRPTFADLWALSQGWHEPRPAEPVAIDVHPVSMSVMRVR